MGNWVWGGVGGARVMHVDATLITSVKHEFPNFKMLGFVVMPWGKCRYLTYVMIR